MMACHDIVSCHGMVGNYEIMPATGETGRHDTMACRDTVACNAIVVIHYMMAWHGGM